MAVTLLARFLFNILFLVLPVVAFSQTGRGAVEGIVKDAETGEALPGANVVWQPVQGQAKVVQTNTSGYFKLKGLDEGTQLLIITFIGYERQQLSVTIQNGQTAMAGVQMQPVQTALSSVEIIGTSPEVPRSLTGTATRITPLELRRISPIGTQEVLTHTPGVYAAADDGFGNSRMSIGIRGLNPRRSSRVLILEDGIPIQPALYVYPLMYYNPPVERLDEVEVIKGSAAIRFGPQTMGGVINYITKRPHEEFGGSVQTVAGNNGYHSLFTEIGGFGTQKIRPELQLIYKGGNGFRDNNDFEQYNATAKLHLLPSEKKQYYLKANFNYERSDATYTGLTEYSFATNPRFNPKKHDEFIVLRGAADLIVTDHLSERLSLTTKTYGTWFNRDWWREDDVLVRAETYQTEGAPLPVPYDTPGDLIRVGNGRSNYGNLRTFYTGGLERNYAYSHHLFGKQSSFSFGGRLHWERFKDQRVVGNKPDARGNEAVLLIHNPATGKDSLIGRAENWETLALALYAQEELKLGENLILTPGFRVEAFEQERIDLMAGSKYQDRTTVVLLPGIGFNYSLGRYNLFGGIHRGFTPPSSSTLANLNFSDTRPGQTTPALDVKAEKSWNKEIGVRSTGKLYQFEVAAFHMGMKDVVAASNLAVFGNLGKVQSYGLELDLRLYLSRQLSWLPDVYFTGTLMRTEITNAVLKVSALQTGSADLAGNELPYAPRISYTAGISREFGSGLSLSTDLQYVSRVFTDYENISYIINRGDTGPVPAYYLLNASASYRLSNRWRVFASGKNLLDTVFIASRLNSDPSRPEQSFGLLPGPRRQLNLGIIYRF